MRQPSSNETFKRKLTELNSLTVRYFEAEAAEIPYDEIAENIRVFSGVKFIILNLYRHESNSEHLTAAAGDRQGIARAEEILGVPLREHIFSPGNTDLERIHENQLVGPLELTDLAGKTFPAENLEKIKRDLGIGQVWTMGLKRNYKILGDIILMQSENPADNIVFQQELIELLIHQIASYILRKRLQEQNEQSAQWFESVVRGLPQVVVYFDAEHKCTFFNNSFLDRIGKTDREITGKHLSEVIGTPAYRKASKYIARADRGQIVEIEGRFHFPQKQELYISGNLLPDIDKSGNISGYLAVFSDVTKFKETEKELEDQLTFVKTLIETIPQPVFYKDADARYSGCNTAFENFFGMKQKDILGKSAFDVWRKEHADQYFSMDIELLTGQKGMQIYESSVIAADGSERDVIFYKAPYYTTGNQLLGIIGTFIDITDQKQHEQVLQQAVKQKDILLREIHHRVKNNLQIISSLLNLQMQHIKDPEAREYFVNSQNRIVTMALVHDYLYHSSDLDSVDMASYITALTRQLEYTLSKPDKSIEFVRDIEHVQLSIEVAIPCGMLINELLTNSFKHAFPNDNVKRGTISLSLHREGKAYLLEVADSGVGIINQPKDTGNPEKESLGMHLIQALVEQLKGEIRFSNHHGTVVSIHIPVQDSSVHLSSQSA